MRSIKALLTSLTGMTLSSGGAIMIIAQAQHTSAAVMLSPIRNLLPDTFTALWETNFLPLLVLMRRGASTGKSRYWSYLSWKIPENSQKSLPVLVLNFGDVFCPSALHCSFLRLRHSPMPSNIVISSFALKVIINQKAIPRDTLNIPCETSMKAMQKTNIMIPNLASA